MNNNEPKLNQIILLCSEIKKMYDMTVTIWKQYLYMKDTLLTQPRGRRVIVVGLCVCVLPLFFATVDL
jgi:hypothetical protein